MDSRICNGVLAGRPYGGVSVLVRKSLSMSAKCIAKRDRFIVLSIGDVVYVHVYFPVKKSDHVYRNELIRLLEETMLLCHRLDLIKWFLVVTSTVSVMSLVQVFCSRNVLKILI